MLIYFNHVNTEPKSNYYFQFFFYNWDAREFTDYFGSRPKFTVLNEIACPSQFLCSIVHLMAYLNDLHMNKKLFHGDIKPANIFLGLS